MYVNMLYSFVTNNSNSVVANFFKRLQFHFFFLQAKILQALIENYLAINVFKCMSYFLKLFLRNCLVSDTVEVMYTYTNTFIINTLADSSRIQSNLTQGKSGKVCNFQNIA